MEYKPSLPEHNDNVSHGRPLKEFFQVLAGMVVFAFLLYWVLGLLLDYSVDRLSMETEAKINSAAALHWKPEKSHSPKQQEMLQSIAESLTQCAKMDYPVTVRLVEGKDPNAAVFPGGQMVVFSGLLEKVKSKNGLAFVLAHELSHLKNRDHLRAMGRGIIIVALSTAITGEAADLADIFLPVNRLSSAKYSQERETLADERALQILNCRYGHAGGAAEFFEALNSDAGKSTVGTEDSETSLGFSHYFSSHPELQARIDNLNRLIRESNMKVGPVETFGKTPV